MPRLSSYNMYRTTARRGMDHLVAVLSMCARSHQEEDANTNKIAQTVPVHLVRLDTCHGTYDTDAAHIRKIAASSELWSGSITTESYCTQRSKQQYRRVLVLVLLLDHHKSSSYWRISPIHWHFCSPPAINDRSTRQAKRRLKQSKCQGGRISVAYQYYTASFAARNQSSKGQ
jgi:hypothetical protein